MLTYWQESGALEHDGYGLFDPMLASRFSWQYIPDTKEKNLHVWKPSLAFYNLMINFIQTVQPVVPRLGGGFLSWVIWFECCPVPPSPHASLFSKPRPETLLLWHLSCGEETRKKNKNRTQKRIRYADLKKKQTCVQFNQRNDKDLWPLYH